MADIPKHLEGLFSLLIKLPVGVPPSPWRQTAVSAVGGLTDVAFAESSDLLLVISSAGRGLFDCATGERIARDPSEDFEFDLFNLTAPGIGPTGSHRFRTAGLHGGGLARCTSDGWSADLLTLSWPSESLFLTPPGHWIYDPAYKKLPLASTKVVTEYEIRAFGFSPTGKTLIFATGSDVTIFHREK